MVQQSNGSLRYAALLGALFSGVTAAVAGCPGPAPSEAPGGSAGSMGSSSSSSSTSGTTTSTTTATTTTTTTTTTTGTTTTTDPCATIQEVCAPTPAGGWSAPFEVHMGTDNTPPCAVPTLQGYSLPAPVVAQCDACKCVPPTNGTCEPLILTIYPGGMCSGMPCTMANLMDACTSLPAFDPTCLSATGISATVTTKVDQGSCTGSQPGLTPPKPFPYNVIGCPLVTSASCASGPCVPTEAGQTNVQVCVMQQGEMSCPAGFYAKQTLVYPTSADSRGCSPCICGDPTGGACSGGQVELEPICLPDQPDGGPPDGGGGADASAPNDGGLYTTVLQAPTTSCTPVSLVPPPGAVEVVTRPTVMGGSCEAIDGGVGSGSLTETGSPVTICCH